MKTSIINGSEVSRLSVAIQTVIYGVVWQQLFYAKCFIEHLSNMTAYCDRFGVLFVGLAQSWNN